MLGKSSRRGCGVRYVGSMGNERNGYTVLVGELQGTRSLGVPWRQWQSYIKLYLEYMGSDGVDWMYRAQDREKFGGDCEHDNILRDSRKLIGIHHNTSIYCAHYSIFGFYNRHHTAQL